MARILLKTIVISILIFLVLPCQAANYTAGLVPQRPEGFNTIYGHDFDVCYGPESQGDASLVADNASTAYASSGSFFKGVPFHPDIIIASSHAEYEKILDAGTLPDYSMSSGWGDGANSAIVIKKPGLVPNFQTAMAHEMAHIATRSYIRGYKYALPEWFSEGLAVYVSGDLSAARRGVIEGRCRSGTLMSIDGLDRVHRLSATGDVTAEDVGAAYTQAGMLVEYVADKYGNGSLLAILDSFGPAGDLDGAFISVTGMTPERINQEWQGWLGAELGRRDGKILEQAVYGYVVDHHGTPMPNETVAITALRNDSPVQGTVYKAMANGTGQYEVKVTYGALLVVAEKPGYEGFNETITLARNQSLFLNVTLNGSALEAALAKAKAMQDQRNMAYLGLGALILAAGAVFVVYKKAKKR